MKTTNPQDSSADSVLTYDFIKNSSYLLKKTDTLNELDLYCYNSCSIDDSDLLKKCRGVVFKGEELIMAGYPYTAEYSTDKVEELVDKYGSDFSSYHVFNSHEGCLLRVFNYGDKWYTTTHKKLDANKSRWSSKRSFGQLLEEAIDNLYKSNSKFAESLGDLSEDSTSYELFLSKLDKTKQYMFLLLNTNENRIVCQAPSEVSVLNVGVLNGPKSELSFEEVHHMPVPTKLELSDIDSVLKYADSVDYNELQGVIVFSKGTCFKIYNLTYLELYEARGNVQSVKFRYLQVRNSKDMVDKLYYLYPQYSDYFHEYENTLWSIGNYITNCYVQRFIKKKRVEVPQDEYRIIRQCHGWHIENRSHNRVNIHKVMDILSHQHPVFLNRLIKRWIQNGEPETKIEEHSSDLVEKPTVQVSESREEFPIL